MYKLFITLLMIVSLTSFSIAATPNIYLTAYTITNSSDVVGEIRLRQGNIVSAKISGESAAAFSIAGNSLKVNKGKLKQGANQFTITLKVKTSAGEQSETFVLVRDQFIKNKVIAHRGAWKNTGASENSIGAFKHAVTLGCEGSEFDVHMSADSLPVVNHDAAVNGTSIAKTNSSELLKIRLSDGESLPTLESYIKAGMQQYKTKLILEIKPSELGKESTIALTRKIIAMVESMHAQAWTDYISFDYEACLEAMKLAPYAKVAYLRGDKTPAELEADHFFGFDYHFSILQKNPEWVKDAQQRKLTINAWTVNDQPIMEELLRQNVDFITTNEPELLLTLIKKP